MKLRVLLAAVSVAALAALDLGLMAGPASAHEGAGIIAVESTEPAEGSTSVRYVVRLTWESDGHAALDATVTAVPVSADGTSGTPVTMQPIDQDGRYEGTVAFAAPGEYQVRFTSITPTGTLEVPQTVAGSPAEGGGPASPSTAAPTASAPATGAEDAAAAADAPPAGARARLVDEDDGGPGGVVIGVIVAVLILAAVGGGLFFYRRRAGP